MTADDADVVLAGFHRLSATSLRSRFFTPVPRITPGVAADLVRVDPASRIILLAFADDGTLAGGARAVRDPADPASADIAVTVGDPFQRRGLGSKLLKLLGSTAMAEGIDRLSGHVLVDNPGGRGLLIANGAVCRLDEPGVLAFEIPLGRYRTVPAFMAQRRLAS